RMSAGEKMARAVCEKYPINIEQIKKIADGCIFKQHIMQALLNAGVCTKIYGKTYKKLFYEGSDFMVDCVQPDIYSVLDAAKKSGATIVMAHPFTYDGIEIMQEIIEKKLIDGIEVWSSKSNEIQEKYLFDIAKNNNLLMTGGSDFHGAYSSKKCLLGEKPTPKSTINIIKNKSK
ncbi:MAG: PHP domain-containing protein, partial [Oscillospiraceae bacterium]